MNYIKRYFLTLKYNHIIKHMTSQDLQDNNNAFKIGKILAQRIPNNHKAIAKRFVRARQNYYNKSLTKEQLALKNYANSLTAHQQEKLVIDSMAKASFNLTK